MGIFNFSNKEKVMLLVQMKAKNVSPVFISTSYLGEVVSRKGGQIVLKNTCIVYEVPGQNRQGGLVISTQYYTHSQVTNGHWKIKEEDVLCEREVQEGDEFLKGYETAFEGFRLDKLNLKRAGAVGPAPDIQGRA